MQRYDWYLAQLVTEGELDGAFDGVENSIMRLAADAGVYGLVQNGEVTEKSGTPNLSVDVAGPLVAYDEDGNRIAVAALTNVPVNVDENSASTTVTAPGNERYLSIFVKFDRTLSDPRLDGGGNSVFFNRAETYEFVVVQGAEALVGAASKPALRAGHILLADVHLIHGQTSVVNADIDFDRTQYLIRVTGTPNEFTARSLTDAFQSVQDQLNDIINGVVTIAATSVTYAGSGNWKDGSSIVGATAEAAIDEIVSDLAAASGAARIGFNPTGNIVADDVQEAIAELDSEKYGVNSSPTFTAVNLVSSSQTLGFGPACAFSSADIVTLAPNWKLSGASSYVSQVDSSVVPGQLTFDITDKLHQGDVITALNLRADPGAARVGANRMYMWLVLVETDGTGSVLTPAFYSDTTSSAQTITSGAISITVDQKTNGKRYCIYVFPGNDGATNNDRVYDGTIVVTRTTLA